MAYSDQCAGRSDCTGVNRFSNPNQTYNGDPLGVPVTPRPSPYVDGPADAVRALNENRQTVAGFRAPPTTPVVLSLKRLTAETTNADTLGWRLTFNMDVQNVTNDDFVLTGARHANADRDGSRQQSTGLRYRSQRGEPGQPECHGDPGVRRRPGYHGARWHGVAHNVARRDPASLYPGQHCAAADDQSGAGRQYAVHGDGPL